MTTNIEWTTTTGPDGTVHPGYTFNPWSGCAKISAGCANCYAAALPPKMRRSAEWGTNGTRPTASDTYWRQPLAWAKLAAAQGVRLKVFCASTADVFEDRADLDPARARLWDLIRTTPELDWLLLTKRPHVMAAWAAANGWPANAWAGTSVENQDVAAIRLAELLCIPARVRFASCEPLIGALDLSLWLGDTTEDVADGPFHRASEEEVQIARGLQWVIAGGESGHGARPMHPDWARGLRDQCAAAGVPFFFKQWGEWAPDCIHPADSLTNVDRKACKTVDRPSPGQFGVMFRCGKERSGRLLDGVLHDAFPPLT